MTAPTGSLPVITKSVDDNRLFFFGFAKQPEIVGGDSISSVVGNKINIYGGDTALTVATPTIDNTTFKVWARVSGGTAGQSYTLQCEILTSSGAEISKSFIMAVQ